MAMTSSPDEPIYTLRVAASRVGLSPRTLRIYEEAGLIEPARTGGNKERLYTEQDLHWLRCIRDMIHGEKLTVTAIRRLLDLIPCWEIRHCELQQAEACAPYLRIPGRCCQGAETAEETAAPAAIPAGQVEIKLIYGVREFGTVMPCSRCIHAERAIRRVAEQYGEAVTIRKIDISSEEAAALGVLLPPAIIVNNELVSAGQGMSEDRLGRILNEQLGR